MSFRSLIYSARYGSNYDLGHATVFIPLESFHLFKDVGMFAAGLAKVDGSIATLIHSGMTDVEVPKQLQGLAKTCRIEFSSGLRFQFRLLCFLKKGRASSVTLYHATRQNLFLALLLRMSGLKVYLKLDMTASNAENFTIIWRRRWRCKALVLKYLFGVPNLVSCEDIGVYRQLKAFKWASRRLQLIPNAMLRETIPNSINFFGSKSNIILVVGRLGTQQKNNELVLNALKLVPCEGLRDWQIHFCGSSTSAFYDKVRSLILERPDLQKAIFFRGQLDRDNLLRMYSISKVLLITSRFEGFSIAALEASWFGCLLASTPVGGIAQLTDNWKLGYRLIDNDAFGLAKFLKLIAIDQLPKLDAARFRMEYVHRNFAMEEMSTKILTILRSGA
jgi:glycosyltransferase involved in cell wall biosynthesis